MRVILAGSRSFGAAVYDAMLEDGHEIVGVWSPTPEPGRPIDKLTNRAIAEGLWERTLDRTPEAVRGEEADLVVAAHSHDFISRPVREATRLGGIGYHPSLLPRHRGRDAVRWTVHMNDPIAGGSVYWLTDNVDGGPIAAQDWCHVHPRDDASTLWQTRLFPMGIALIRQVLLDLDSLLIVEVPQDERYATWEPSWERPPLHRPDLPQIGTGIPGFKHVTSRGAGGHGTNVFTPRVERAGTGW